ncbi:MAG: transcription repressor NadR [Thermoflavifilum sp.]|nr:transcription repressor NadR [Thermoflavifilum sp.]MCL6512951.1 transcription repressor NadR [Alicyclobacillus sp.]
MRDRAQRQQRIVALLKGAQEPVTGSDLARWVGVTRQVVVHDVAVLRAAGAPILSTPRGYLWQPAEWNGFTAVLAVRHPPELTETELNILVDHGIHVQDVIVEHPIYGELRGTLRLASRRDVQLFLDQVRSSGAALLSNLTGGYHMHTVTAPDDTRLAEAVRALQQHGIEVFDD